MLGIGQTLIWALLKSGELKGFKIRNRRLVDVASIKAFLEAKLTLAKRAASPKSPAQSDRDATSSISAMTTPLHSGDPR